MFNPEKICESVAKVQKGLNEVKERFNLTSLDKLIIKHKLEEEEKCYE